LDSLKAVAAAARTLNLEVSDELQDRLGAPHRVAWTFGEEGERHRRFAEDNAKAAAETLARVTAPDPIFANLERTLDGKRFHDKRRDYGIERLATSKEHNAIVAECRPIGRGGIADPKSRLVYYGVESEGDFDEMMEMIRLYDERAAIAAIKSAKAAELSRLTTKRAAVSGKATRKSARSRRSP
jgi:hypothetical protein